MIREIGTRASRWRRSSAHRVPRARREGQAAGDDRKTLRASPSSEAGGRPWRGLSVSPTTRSRRRSAWTAISARRVVARSLRLRWSRRPNGATGFRPPALRSLDRHPRKTLPPRRARRSYLRRPRPPALTPELDRTVPGAGYGVVAVGVDVRPGRRQVDARRGAELPVDAHGLRRVRRIPPLQSDRRLVVSLPAVLLQRRSMCAGLGPRRSHDPAAHLGVGVRVVALQIVTVTRVALDGPELRPVHLCVDQHVVVVSVHPHRCHGPADRRIAQRREVRALREVARPVRPSPLRCRPSPRRSRRDRQAFAPP